MPMGVQTVKKLRLKKPGAANLLPSCVAGCSGSFREIPSFKSGKSGEKCVCVHEVRFTIVSIFNKTNPVTFEAAGCQCAFLIQNQCFH